METGKLANLSTRPVGTNLRDDHPAGSTSLAVDDAGEFDEHGGQLLVGTEMLTYTDWDEDDDTIELVGPTGADWPAGELVTVLPPTSVMVATVVLDGEGEALDDVIVPAQFRAILTDGLRAGNGVGAETITVDEIDGDWVVTDVR